MYQIRRLNALVTVTIPPIAVEKEFEHDVAHPVVSTKAVEAFLTTLVNETSIAELQVQVRIQDRLPTSALRTADP